MPADTFSAILGTLVMGTGNDNNSWGDNANNNVFLILEKALAGFASHAVTGGTLVLSGSPPPAGPTAALEMLQKFTGTLASNQIVQVPNLPKLWIVQNSCTLAGFTLQFKTPSGLASLAIPFGITFVFCDGSDNILVGLSTSLRDIQWLGPDGTLAAPGQSFASEPGSGWRRVSAGVFRYVIGGVDIFEISATAFNLLVGALQIGGGQVVPPGSEQVYAGIELPAGGWLWEDGTAYSRASFAALFAALTKTTTGNTHNTTTIDTIPIDLRGRGLEGAQIEGTGIATGTTIVSIAASSLVLSAAASSNTSITIRILPWGQGDASTTFNVPDRRDRTVFGRGNMNGTAANRLTVNASTHLNTTGGEETHTLTTPEIAAHSHTLHETPHSHSYSQGTSSGFIFAAAANLTAFTSSSTGATTGSASTGITMDPAGGGGAHNTMPVFGITNFIIKT